MKRSSTLYHNQASAYTLVEMLVAMAVLSTLILMINTLFDNASQTISESSKHMSADGEARLIFNRMADDFSGMLKRADVDCIFYKPELSGSTGSGQNDSLFFYSQAPAYFASGMTSNSSSPVSLLGYRIDSHASTDSNYQQLERLGQGLTWDNASSNVTGGVVFLTWKGTSGFDANSLLTSWSALGAAPYNTSVSTLTGSSTSMTAPYQVIGDQAFRLEFCFLLKDGSYSNYPVLNQSTQKNNLTATSSPTASSDSTAGYAVGSRWYNTSTGEAFICTNATAGAAVWSGAGVNDISAVIVSLALLDNTSRKLLPSTAALASALSNISDALTDANANGTDFSTSPAILPAANWTTKITSSGFAASVGVLQPVVSQLRVYQRYFYLNSSQVQ